MFSSIAILGRQPALGIAELESLYGSDNIEPFGIDSCLVKIDSKKIDFNRLGGSVRFCEIITETPNKWQDIETNLLNNISEYLPVIDGKLNFGLSVFGLSVSPKNVARTSLNLKKAIKKTGQSVRMVPHNDVVLGSATILYNKLTSENGVELCVISNGKKTFLARTTNIQDIDAYADRDRNRPKRDAKVGMLPPKLAQIIINLSVNQHEVNRILDPFCGTGVLLQEAMLMDYDIVGTDIEPRMIQYSIENLDWIDTKFPDKGDYRRIEIADATSHNWNESDKISNIAAETFLGQPLSSLPPSDQLRKIMREANEINHKFLLNIAKQLKPGSRLCVAVPTWRGKHEFLHLPLLAHLTEMGYNRMKFKHVDNSDLIYHREHQVVGRELLVLEKR